MKINHPAALAFFSHHFIKCNDAKINKDSFREQSDLPSIILHRNTSLYKAVEYMKVLFLLGDNSQIENYYRLLKLLKF